MWRNKLLSYGKHKGGKKKFKFKKCVILPNFIKYFANKKLWNPKELKGQLEGTWKKSN